MKGPDCEIIRDLLPDFGAGCLFPEEAAMVEAHLGSCPDCSKDLEVIVALRGARPEVPADLEARIQARVRNEMAREEIPVSRKTSKGTAGVLPLFGRPRWAPAWPLSAAAVLTLALGVGLVWNQLTSDPILDPVLVASQEPLPEAWLWDDGMVAGAPVFDGLSDEDLEALLKEFEG